jgi:predicted DNA-binding antitoxin AbrB/MazE fold protein
MARKSRVSKQPVQDTITIKRQDTMTQTIEAIYEEGVLKPLQPLDLPEHQPVSITIHVSPSETPEEALKSWEQVYEGLTPEEIAEVEAMALDRHNFMRQGE